MNHKKSKVKKTSVISNPISLWCGHSNQGLKNAGDLPGVSAGIGLESLLSTFGPYS